MEQNMVTGIAAALDEIKARGWDAVMDSNLAITLVDDIAIDPNTDDLEGEYVIDVNQVVRMRNDFRGEIVWVRE